MVANSNNSNIIIIIIIIYGTMEYRMTKPTMKKNFKTR